MCRTMTKSDDELVCRTVSSKYLMRRPWMTIRCDSVAIPGGKVNPEYYVLEYPGWINVIAIDESGNMLLERQWRQAAGIISTEIPAGVMEKGETPLQAARRELLEETGYTGGEWSELLTLYPNPGLMNNKCHCFLARGVRRTDSQHLDETECLEVFTATQEEVFRLLCEGAFMQAMMVAPLWKYFYKNRK